MLDKDQLRKTVFIDAGERKKAVVQLQVQGLSLRQIAAAVGVGKDTVARDLGVANARKSVANATPAIEVSERDILDAAAVNVSQSTVVADLAERNRSESEQNRSPAIEVGRAIPAGFQNTNGSTPPAAQGARDPVATQRRAVVYARAQFGTTVERPARTSSNDLRKAISALSAA